MKLNPKLEAVYQKMKGIGIDKPGLESFSVCQLCGFPTWRSTQGDSPTSRQFNIEGTCSNCESTERLHPEVFQWVLHVLAFHIAQGHEGEET